MYKFKEFFAGGGMVRAGLGSEWDCVLANEICGKKGLTYQRNWGVGGELLVKDIAKLTLNETDDPCDLAWASFPCQDLSVAGLGAGLSGPRSGTFFEFWKKIAVGKPLTQRPKIVIVENVCGLLRSNNGSDFQAVVTAFRENGYFAGGLIINAAEFLPQSRKRIFVIGTRNDLLVDPSFVTPAPDGPFFPKQIIEAFQNLPPTEKANWLWWNISPPARRQSVLLDILENDDDVQWNSADSHRDLLSAMSPTNLKKVEAAQNSKERVAGAVFKRTRRNGIKRSVFAEVRFDGLAGCLRTPNGGSSRQTVIVVDGAETKSRLLTPRETARLMGLSEHYKLPTNRNEALHLTGDGVAVPVVEFLRDRIFEPFLNAHSFFSKVSVSNLKSARVGR